MNYKVTVVFFSPTKGTKKYIEEIAGKISSDFEIIDLTQIENKNKDYYFSKNDLVIIGAPVYAGRLPDLEGGIFNCIHGKNTPAVFNVSYGNREFDDALLEEKEICEKNGFKGIAAAAWIAPHTFSEKIAAGRPDAEDEKIIEKFVEKIKIILEKGPDKELEVPGNNPHKDLKKMPFSPEVKEKCDKCNTCIKVCPTGAISALEPERTDNNKCIACLACVKSCPKQVRIVDNPVFIETVKRLEDNLLKIRKEPQLFY